MLAIAIIIIWFFCCGGREKQRQQRLARQGATQPALQNREVPLQTYSAPVIANRTGPLPGDVPPPTYTETLPPRHQRIAGGITNVRDEEEGVIADGKTPLSEIPFEDVVVSSSSSHSSARDFGRNHQYGGGNTLGHTNS